MTEIYVLSERPRRQLLFGTTLSGLNIDDNRAQVSSNAFFSADTKYAQIFPAFPSTKTLTTVGFYAGTKVGTPATHKLSLQSIDSFGRPTGTILGGGSPASVTFAGAAMTANTWNDYTLDNSYDVTSGDDFAIVMEYDSGTINFSNYIQVRLNRGDTTWTQFNHPLAIGKSYTTTNGWNYAEYDAFWLRVGDGTDTWRGGSFSANYTEIVFNNSSSPDEYGMKFQVAEPCYASHVVSPYAYTGGSGRDVDHRIYDTNDNVLASVNTADMANNSQGYGYNSPLAFDSPCLLLPGRDYRVTVKSNDTTDVRVYYFDVVNTDVMRDHFLPSGIAKAGTYRDNAGSWTDETTRAYIMSVLGYGAPSVVGSRKYIRVPRRGTNDKRGIIRRG